MREILFRGKRVDNGEWVYGNYIADALSTKNYAVDWGFIKYYSHEESKSYTHEVELQTVGQYTGMTDKNGNKIFEGDFFKDDDEDGLTLRCIFKDGAFCVEIRGIKGALMEWGYDEYAGDFEVIECENISYYDGYLEIIGNIHDGI